MKLIIFLLINIFIFSVCAGDYPVVIITKTQPDYIYTGAFYKTVITDIGPGSEQIPPAGYVVTQFTREGDRANDLDYAFRVYADGKRTIGDMVMEAYNNSPANIQNGYNTFDRSPYNCITWGAAPERVSAWSSLIAPGGCMAFPPTTQSCKFTTPEILLDHGSLGATDGDMISEQISLQCSAQTDVKFSLAGTENYIYMGNQKAEITINNQSLGSKITLPSGDSTVNIKDKLIGNFPEGAYTGSGVLIMAPY